MGAAAEQYASVQTKTDTYLGTSGKAGTAGTPRTTIP